MTMMADIFFLFFDETKGHFFIPKFIGQYDNEINTSFATIFKDLDVLDDASVFLKMDIEGAEYLCLPQVMPFLDTLTGMTIEFHHLAIADAKFTELLTAFADRFYIAHVHGNNYSRLIYPTTIPETLEITFINKQLVPEAVVSLRDYPIEGLDAPCNKDKDDYKLTFTNEKSAAGG